MKNEGKMSLNEVSKKNSPVDDKDLLFLISMLDREDKVEFVQEFVQDFEEMVEQGMLSKTGLRKLLSGYAPSDERVLQVIEMNEKAKRWIIERVKEKAKRALEIISRMEAEEE